VSMDDAAWNEAAREWYDFGRALQHVRPRVPAWGFAPLPTVLAGFRSPGGLGSGQRSAGGVTSAGLELLYDVQVTLVKRKTPGEQNPVGPCRIGTCHCMQLNAWPMFDSAQKTLNAWRPLGPKIRTVTFPQLKASIIDASSQVFLLLSHDSPKHQVLPTSTAVCASHKACACGPHCCLQVVCHSSCSCHAAPVTMQQQLQLQRFSLSRTWALAATILATDFCSQHQLGCCCLFTLPAAAATPASRTHLLLVRLQMALRGCSSSSRKRETC
jgi:hypothetical protein